MAEIDVIWTNGQQGLISLTVPGFDPNEAFKSRLVFEYEPAGQPGAKWQSAVTGSGNADAEGNAVTYAWVPAPNGHLTGNVWTDNVAIDEQVSLS